MPKPSDGENRKDFVSRCISMVMHEGKTKDVNQAAAICYNMWKQNDKQSSKNMIQKIAENVAISNEMEQIIDEIRRK